MKKLKQNPMDQFFRDSLESPDLEYKEEDWRGLEKLLSEKSRNRVFPIWKMLAGIAAVLLIVLSVWFFRGTPVSEEQMSKVSLDKNQNTSSTKEFKSAPASGNGKTKNLKTEGNSSKNTYIANKVSKSGLKTQRILTNFSAPKSEYINYALILRADNKGQLKTDPLIMIPMNQLYPSADISENENSERTKTDESYNRISLSFAVSPDLNSAENFNKGSLGGSFGIGTGYRVNKLLNISTGVYYSKKTYSANPAKYKSSASPFNFAKYASSIDADCRVLDVPLNLNFNVLNKPNQTLFASVGLSSYFMLNEKYTFIRKTNSGYPNTGPEPSYTIDNKNKHIFSVLNIAAGLSKPIGKNSDLVIQPYAKLPLTGIGQGKANLQSVGVAFQLNYKFLKKPSNSKLIKQPGFQNFRRP